VVCDNCFFSKREKNKACKLCGGGGTVLCDNCLLQQGEGEAGKRVVGKREGESRGSVRESRGEAGGRVEGKREGGQAGGRVVVEWRESEGEQIFHCSECSRKKCFTLPGTSYNILHFEILSRTLYERPRL